MIIRLLRRCHLSFLFLLSACQLLALAACFLAPQNAGPLARFPLLLTAALLICAGVPIRMRRVALGVCTAALLGAGQLLLPPGAMALVMPASCAALLLFSISYAGKNPAQAAPMFYFFCAAAQAVSLFFQHYAGEALHAMAYMRGAFFLWLLLFALAFNRISLNNATLSRYHLSTGMARTGTVLTLCVFALTAVLCAMPVVVSGVIRLFGAMRDVGVWLLLLVLNLFPSGETGGVSGPGAAMLPELGMPIDSEPSFFAVALEKVATVFAFVVLIIGSALLLRLAALALVRLARRVIAYLQRHASIVTEDYEDEISDTREGNSEHTFLSLRRSARKKRTYPDTPAGRIRRRYAQLLSRNPAWADSSTARENLPAYAAALYERARYSKHMPTEQDALLFEQETQKIRKQS